MKIGIITFWNTEDNYGGMLQCYAMQKYLRTAGYDAYLIRYNSQKDVKTARFLKRILKVFNPVLLLDFILFRTRRMLSRREAVLHPRCFSEFRNMFIKQSQKLYNSYEELKENPPEAEVYIAGSDQIWNAFVPIKRALNSMRAYLLDFGDSSVRRISYAASFGRNRLDDYSIEIFALLLKKFDYISVREKSGLSICKQCGIDAADWVPDPTMLLDVKNYRALYQAEELKKQTKPYCFLYILGNKFKFPVKEIFSWAKQRKIEVVYVTGNAYHDKFEKTYATIPEWISLIDNAECVITNSYHCSIFSLLFSKNFAVIPLAGKDAGMNERMFSLFEMFHIEPRFLAKNMDVLDIGINWDDISNCFKILRSENTLLKLLSAVPSL
jgi:hypothetical protein